MIPDGGPIWMDQAAVERRLEQLDIAELISNVFIAQHRGDVTLPPESYLRWHPNADEQARSLAMHALIRSPEQIAGVKIINANPANIEAGLARASGLTLLFDTKTAEIRAVVPAAAISAARTAAVSTVAIDRCRAPGSGCLAFIGSGPVARWHARLLTRANRPCTSITVFDQSRERAESFAAYCADVGFPAHVATTAREAVAASDVIVTATTTTTPYVEMDWLRPGAVIVNVSLDDVSADVLLRCDRLFVDDWSLIIDDQHRLLGRLAREGRICGPGEHDGSRAVTGTIAELVASAEPGRLSESDIVVINPFGMACSDIALAHAVVG